jgi:hypothetical protein
MEDEFLSHSELSLSDQVFAGAMVASEGGTRKWHLNAASAGGWSVAKLVFPLAAAGAYKVQREREGERRIFTCHTDYGCDHKY